MKVQITSVLLTLLVGLQSLANISTAMKTLVDMETKANAVAVRSNEAVKIEHFEIPLRLVEQDVMKSYPKDIIASLIFEKNGEPHIRWMINPEDTKWHKEVEKWLTENKVSTERHHHFIGYQTASRSYIIYDPETKAEFSLKVSTNVTGGNWTDKKQTWEDASQIRMLNDFILDRLSKFGGISNTVVLYEPATFGIKALDQGMVVRSYGDLPKSKFHYLPGFSAVHEDVGRRIAEINGSNNPAEFWNKHYNLPLARSLAEFAALTGVVYDSPHSQNFMIELDKNMKPTGRIVLRDFGDSYLNEDFFKAVGRSDIPRKWEQPNITRGNFYVAVGIMHGNEPPSWLDMKGKGPNSYNSWGADFFTEYSKAFEEKTNFNLNWASKNMYRSGAYFNNSLVTNDSQGRSFLNALKKGSAYRTQAPSCRAIYKNAG